MKDKLCCGFFYDTEEELKSLLGIDEYLDMIFDKTEPGYISESEWSYEYDIFNTPLGMEVFIKRKAEGLTQRELAKKLGIAVDTLSKIENGHEHLSFKVKSKIDDYLDADEY